MKMVMMITTTVMMIMTAVMMIMTTVMVMFTLLFYFYIFHFHCELAQNPPLKPLPESPNLSPILL